MRNTAVIAAAILIAGNGRRSAQQKPRSIPPRSMPISSRHFPTAPADWKPRFDQDETMKECSCSENSPPKAVADAIAKREKAKIEYPADGKLIGDWKDGEKLAQSGYGLRFTDYPPRRPTAAIATPATS